MGLSEHQLFQEASKQRRVMLFCEKGRKGEKKDNLSNIFLRHIWVVSELGAGRSVLLEGLEPAEPSIKQCFGDTGSHRLQVFEAHHRSSFPEDKQNSLPRYLALIFLGLTPFQ